MRNIGTIKSSLIVWSVFVGDHETIYCADGDGMLQIVRADGESVYRVLDQLELVGAFTSLSDALEFGQDRLEHEYPEVFEKRFFCWTQSTVSAPNDGVELADWAGQGCNWARTGAISAALRARAATLTADEIAALGEWADQQPDGIVTQTAITEYLIGEFEHLNGVTGASE